MDVQGILVKDPKIELDLLNVDPMCRYENAYPVSLFQSLTVANLSEQTIAANKLLDMKFSPGPKVCLVLVLLMLSKYNVSGQLA